MLGLVWCAPSPLWQPPVGLAQTETAASVLSIYSYIKHGVPLKNDSGFLGLLFFDRCWWGVHFASCNDSLTCHSPYFHTYLDFSYLWHFRQPHMWISAELTSGWNAIFTPAVISLIRLFSLRKIKIINMKKIFFIYMSDCKECIASLRFFWPWFLVDICFYNNAVKWPPLCLIYSCYT